MHLVCVGNKIVSSAPDDTKDAVGFRIIVSRLCEEAELDAQMFNLAQMFIRIPNVQFSTEPAFLQNPC